MKTVNVLNAYLIAPAKEKTLTMLGPEFGKDASSIVPLYSSSVLEMKL